MATVKTPRTPASPKQQRAVAKPDRKVVGGFEPLPPVPATHENSLVDPARIWYQKLSRYNPIRNLTPDSLGRQMDSFAQGYLREFAQTMEAIANRDDRLACVIPKRKSALARRSWEVIAVSDTDSSNDAEAEKHKEALAYFYNNVTVTNAVDLNQRRGFSLLIEQMLDAQAKKYAVHEILWRPSDDGLTAVFNFVPLWFFENRSGKLRFLSSDFDMVGTDLEERNWMTTVGLGLMEPCAVAYMFKNLPMKDWLLYCEKHGMPGIHGKTDHALGSAGWNNLVDAVQAVAADFSCVTSKTDEIEKLDFTASGQLPYPVMVERMDRAMASLWMGGDLSTMSKDNQAVGSDAQADGSDTLEQDDAMLVTETLNAQVDTKVIEWMFGEGTKPLAYVKVIVPPKLDHAKEILIDDHLAKYQIPVSLKGLVERYGRTLPMEGEEIVEAAVEKTDEPSDEPSDEPLDEEAEETGENPFSLTESDSEKEETDEEGFANIKLGKAAFQRRFLKNALATMARSTSDALAPMRDEVRAILEMPNETMHLAALATFRDTLADKLKAVNAHPANAAALENVIAASLFNGLALGEVKRKK